MNFASFRKIAGGLAVVVGIMTAEAAEFPAQNFAITPPTGWEKQDVGPDVFMSYVRPDKNAVVVVTVDSVNQVGDVGDERVIAEFEKGLVSSGGGERIWGRVVERDGIKVYERLGKMQIDDRDVTAYVRFFAVRGHAYGIQGLTFDGDASKDPEVLAFLDSFRFLKTPSPVTEATVAYKVGQRLGKAFVYTLIGGPIIAGLAILIWFLVRKSRNKAA